MPTEPKPAKVSVPASGDETSELSQAQLSTPGGVHIGVSSIAMDRGLLALGSGVPPAHAEAGLSADGLTDAEVMLRVKAGDEAAFDYLLQKYRRPMMTFMYRMARNPAVVHLANIRDYIEGLVAEAPLPLVIGYPGPARAARRGTTGRWPGCCAWRGG